MRASFLFAASILVGLFGVSVGANVERAERKIAQIRYGQSLYPGMSIARANKIALYSETDLPEGSTVLLGDSITEFLPPIDGAVNRGIAGDTVGGLVSRFDAEDYRRAGHIVVMIGINDLQSHHMPDVQPLANMLCALDRPVTWMSVLPVNAEMHHREILTRSPDVHTPTVEEVNALNLAIARTAETCSTLIYSDMRLAFVDGDGQLRQPLTVDGLHLSASGMAIFADQLRRLQDLEGPACNVTAGGPGCRRSSRAD